MANSVSGRAFDVSLFKRVMRYVRPYNKLFYLTGALTILLAILTPLRPYLIQYTVDNAIVKPNGQLLITLTIVMVSILIVEGGVQFIQTYMANKVGQSVIKDLRNETYDKIVNFKLKYFDRTPIGRLVTRAVSDIETISEIFSQGILIIVGDILKLVVVIGFMFYIDWRLTLFSLVPIPLLIIATNIFKNYIKAAFQDVRNAVSNLNSFVQEHITGMNIVQIFNQEKREHKRFSDINKEHMKAHIRTVWANSIFFPVVEILSATSIALLVWWGSKSVIQGEASLGNLVAFILYIYMLFRPIRQLADRFNVLQMGMVASERVFKVLDTDARIEDSGDKIPSYLKGKIEFDHVWFAYEGEDWILKDLTFDVSKGETVAFVGETGAGKTSVINLLSRFYEFQKGSITIDREDIRTYDLAKLRERVGVVLQDVFLFSDSIYNNITLYNDSISKEKVIEASKLVGAHEFIMKLPGNYDFNVRERGGMLSVGQRQLIAFIRAYVYDPSILVLDEATSSVDTESEMMIQRAIEVLTKGRTSIVIAHRLATIQNADKIIVLDKGRVMEIGNHQELLKKDGHYKTLYELQFSDAEEK
ncbi:ABC transporter ATP-binding protein [Salibacter halophilus]|uniref:ABC transporter ATP-binding protein n=1 Tax=Salibacter halophilus TaxID=1803916 RepID=A0A6N6M866_9FLAO|nr:ABC transporter ATP-binding protein [Salibacter halophilus]KAB1064840.1 ABC transporter ATP-binding protein [Salibacter halophilus]